jgi:hypothetical protein
MPHLSPQSLTRAEQRRLRRVTAAQPRLLARTIRAPTVSRWGSSFRARRLIWLPKIALFRTLCLMPTREVLAVFRDLRTLTLVFRPRSHVNA